MEAESIDDEGETITKGKALALLLFKKALGFTETHKDNEGVLQETYHKPESWAIQYIYDRLEGRVPQAVTEQDNGPTIADKIREISKARANDLAQKSQSAPRESRHLENPKK